MHTQSSPVTARDPDVALTLRYQLAIYGTRARQTQYVTPRYVITEVDDQRLLFHRERDTRYLVSGRNLLPLDDSAQVEQARQIRAELGEVTAERIEPSVEVAGLPCSRFVVRIDHPRLVASGEVCVARVPGIERTALADDRALQSRAQPFMIPLERGEIVVSSSVRMLARGMALQQTLTLESVEHSIAERARIDECLDYPVAR